jgi:hypothetical protein
MLLHFQVGLRLYVIPKWHCKNQRAPFNYRLLSKVNTLNRCKQAGRTPISSKGKPLDSHMVGWVDHRCWEDHSSMYYSGIVDLSSDKAFSHLPRFNFKTLPKRISYNVLSKMLIQQKHPLHHLRVLYVISLQCSISQKNADIFAVKPLQLGKGGLNQRQHNRNAKVKLPTSKIVLGCVRVSR